MSAGNIDENTSEAGLRVFRISLGDIPLFLGYIISFLLQGVLIVQVFAYFLAFKTDRKYIKLAVWFVFVLECVSTIVSTVAAIKSLALEGRLSDLTIDTLFRSLFLICGLVVLVVHTFYCYRIHILGARVAVPIVVFTLSMGQCVLVIITGFGVQETLVYVSHVAWLVLTAASDCSIAITLILLLTRASRNLPTAAAKTRVQRAMMICVETGSITGLAALLQLVLYISLGGLGYIVLFFILSKLYSNCMMATLNARLALSDRTFREGGDWKPAPGVPPLAAMEERKESDSIDSVVDIRRASRLSNGSV
ncbi:hypothetical protein V5O48_012274 [Marasmius crinis-equi]|uniref:DUF6534 domain-containing protein n=1 Tax=Marasmius crinis-equi TaxID=585013 RepID=A0ABR3F3J2_9AGAR